MALDRQEAKAEIQANNVPSVTNATMNVMLQQNILDNVLLRKDEKSTASGAGLSTYTANFANDEQVILTGVNQNIAISFSNLEDGDVRYLYVTKGATNVVSFSGANDMIQNRYYIDNFATSVLYRITSKNSLIFVEAILSPAVNSWVSITPSSGWSGTLRYRINNFTGKIEMYINLTSSGSLSGVTIATMPASINPAVYQYFVLASIGTETTNSDAVTIAITNANAMIIVNPSFSTWTSGGVITGVFEYYLKETF